MKIVMAEYSPAILPEHRGNPFIEALPRYIDSSELAVHLSFYPEASDEERKLSPYERKEYLYRLDYFRQALPEYLECYWYIDRAIRLGYSSKNPLLPSTNNYLHYPVGKRPDIHLNP